MFLSREFPSHLRGVAVFLSTALVVMYAISANAEETAGHTLMGVASCASSNCHGGFLPRNQTPVLQNEYITWLKHDKHSQAWKVLLSPESKRIGWQLGLEDPSREKACLQCHSSISLNSDQPGKKFRIEDGVGCESCHGTAENWISTHTVTGATHADNVARDLVPLDDPTVRAKKCLSCHQGDEQRQITHRLYGAGHPRLSFELDTYEIIQPAHWLNDEDYLKRKGKYVPLKVWIAGQQISASRSIQLIQALASEENSLFPELSAFTCSSCHHNLSEKEFMNRDYRRLPGNPHLNLAALRMISIALNSQNQRKSKDFTSIINAIERSSSLNEIEDSLDEMADILGDEGLRERLTNSLDATMLMHTLLTFAVENPSLYYETAEQIAMGLVSAHAEISRGAPRPPLLDQIFVTLQVPDAFQPQDFSDACRKYLKTIRP